MSREIKIRFWDKTTNTMIYPMVHYESICIVKGKMKPSLSNNIVDNWNWYKREYEPLEYTGLKDKNGTEIYEGDIVQFKNSFGGLTGVVRYYANCKPIIDKNKRSVDIAECNEEDLEVIGNIYKNPELLEED